MEYLGLQQDAPYQTCHVVLILEFTRKGGCMISVWESSHTNLQNHLLQLKYNFCDNYHE